MPHIDYYFVTVSPWAYLAGDRLEAMAGRHGATVSYKPVDLGKVFAATGGLALKDRSQARQDYRLQELARAQAKTGLPLNIHPAHFPTNPAPSSYAIIAAQKEGGEVGRLVQAIMRSCWADEKNIAEDEVIRACLEEAGFDPSLADSGLLTGATVYEENTEAAIREGVFGSPFYVVDSGQKFWGQDRLEDLEAHLAGRL
ncbi:2-hydroxychromene-2-carboxylate isomerase [Pseudooceanicola nanhaiensis]|jgi:2-hydroxychromene-2-carboxylate isomerase|uniref:2-hydroxychromene-2-carboxylate isomerase n=1 Tax=Pseudooceanicola nanhaiensis TaxID=375761 RepID=A0A917WDF9_9RHOB|nr:2-hydroxychromene-2-carboxylate isomerase [Pseudooceanicola nanhaiensis]GGL95043.1 2-hydroxychromene-2-carboxylate isomerase [Pseudooceanicola nanhaiensis]